jgi:hypothetical protein
MTIDGLKMIDGLMMEGKSNLVGAFIGDGRINGARPNGLKTNIGALVGTAGALGALVGSDGALGALVGVGSALAGAAAGADGELGVDGALGADGMLGADGEPGIDGALPVGTDGALGAEGEPGVDGALADGVLGAIGAGAEGAFGALGDEGAVGDVRYFLQQRGMGRPCLIKRRQIFLPRFVLQKNAEDGVLQVSNTASVRSFQDERIEFILPWLANEMLD